MTNIIIIGCGRIGKMHTDIICRHHPEVTIAGVVDDHVAPEWLEARGLRGFGQDELPALLANPAIDAVVIAASSSEHVKLACLAANAGKHVFCEKPISFDAAQLDAVIEAADKNRIKLQVGLNRRFDPDFQRVKQVVDDGLIGDIRIIKITNRDPKRPDLKFIPNSGGLFLDFNVHDFDMARFISHAEISEVYAMGANLVDPKIGELGDIDTTIITAKLSNGAFCVIDSSRETHYGYDQRLEVFGSKGNIIANNTAATNTTLSTDAAVSTEKPHYSFVERYADAYQAQMAAFFKAIQTDTSVLVNARDVKKAVVAAQMAGESFKTKMPMCC
jgi:myo-inositol 2-dehydrogenase / D-chiro-inositol 1-dehydrogenase